MTTTVTKTDEENKPMSPGMYVLIVIPVFIILGVVWLVHATGAKSWENARFKKHS